MLTGSTLPHLCYAHCGSITDSAANVSSFVQVALLNLEMNYGTEEQLLETFSRASRENDELGIKSHMAVIYASSGKHELAEKMYSGLIKKFPEELQVWFALFALYFDQQKKVLNR